MGVVERTKRPAHRSRALLSKPNHATITVQVPRLCAVHAMDIGTLQHAVPMFCDRISAVRVVDSSAGSVRFITMLSTSRTLTVLSRALCFMFISFPFTVFVWICSDLHERRKTRLGPKRVVITAGVAFFLLMFAMALWLSCTINPYGPLGSYCPNFAGLTVPWGWWYGDLVPFLPFMAVLDMVL